MNKQIFFREHHKRILIAFVTILSLSLSGWNRIDLASLQGPNPTLTIEAPSSVEVGDRIEVQLIVEHAHDLAGYEAQLLFDTAAAHFSGLHQRDSDLKKFGRDVIPLEIQELPDGVAMGLASCPYADCVELKGNPQPRGADGKVRLATVLIGTDQQGRLELSFEHLKFVDSSGNIMSVEVPTPRINVQVGPDNGVTFTAPASSWQVSTSPPTAGNFDITGDSTVNYADAIEAAFEWTVGRQQRQPCGPANDLSRDVNGDGCIDVVDIQLILANTTGTRPRAHSAEPVLATGSKSGAVAPLAATLTFVVNSTSDAVDSNIGDGICASSSGCTLRAAIEEANRHFGPDIILFNIPGSGVQTIQLNSRLPSLWDGSGGTTIDGYSQPGAQPNTDSLVSNAKIMIQIRGNGSTAFHALLLQSAGNRVQGLAIFNARSALWIYGSGARDNIIVGNFLGTNAAGTFVSTVHASSANGVLIDVGPVGNHVGGTATAERNVISGNGRHGMEINSEGTDNNEVFNNLIGLNPAGNQRLQNMRHGIDINGGPSNNIIGGTGPGQRNIISGNGEFQETDYTAGIEISHDTLTNKISVIGNCIGTDPTCTAGPAWAVNSHYGMRIEDGVNENIVANNVIGNNRKAGIKIDGTGTNNNQVYNNRIGVSLNNTAIPNGDSTIGFGIQIATSSKSNKIGPNNIIANNYVGVELLGDNTDNHTITQNSIFNNNRLGIDLGPALGVTANDSGDGDIGPNQGLNVPVLNNATLSSASGTACAETAVSKPCTIEIFIAERRTSDSGGGNYGQGRTFVGSGTTSANGSFAVAVSGVTAGQYLTATATDATGNTSEFAFNIIVSGGSNTPTPTPTSQPLTPTPTGQPPTPTPAGKTTYAADTFTRNITDGWGSADVGGSYTLIGSAAQFDVDGFAGTMNVPLPGAVRSAILPNPVGTDLDFTFRVKTDKLAVGGNQGIYFIGRRVAANTEYWGQIRTTPSRTVYLLAYRVINGSPTQIAPAVLVNGLTHVANSYIWVHGQTIGTNPTTIRLKAWADGQAEPASWQFTTTDSTATLQTTGSSGLRAYMASSITNAPIVVTFDDFRVTSP